MSRGGRVEEPFPWSGSAWSAPEEEPQSGTEFEREVGEEHVERDVHANDHERLADQGERGGDQPQADENAGKETGEGEQDIEDGGAGGEDQGVRDLRNCSLTRKHLR